jgi:hypothetical protein
MDASLMGSSLVLHHCCFPAKAAHVVSGIQADFFCQRTSSNNLHARICTDAFLCECGGGGQDWMTGSSVSIGLE